MKVSDTRLHERSGLTFTAMGYGGGPIGNYNGVFTDHEAAAMVRQSWDQGVRYFDTAPGYGNGLSEYRMGHALRQCDTSQFVLSTKVGRVLKPTIGAPNSVAGYHDIPPMVAEYDYSYDGVMRAVEQSMQRMLTDRFDALFMHDCDVFTHGTDQPTFFNRAVASGFSALESLRDQGVVKAIGFGVNETEVMTAAVKAADVDLCLLAGRYTLLEQDPLDDLLPMCEDRGIGLVLGGVFNSGILATGPVAGARFNYAPAPKDVLHRTQLLADLCRRHDTPLAAVALQFAYAHPVVTTICIGARNGHQQARNANLFEVAVPQDLWKDLRDEGLIREDAPTPTA